LVCLTVIKRNYSRRLTECYSAGPYQYRISQAIRSQQPDSGQDRHHTCLRKRKVGLKKKATIQNSKEREGICSSQPPVRAPGRKVTTDTIVHFITRNNKVRKSSELSLQKSKGRECDVGLIGGYCMKRLGVRPFELIIYHGINIIRRKASPPRGESRMYRSTIP
jgi:hypothetical protein